MADRRVGSHTVETSNKAKVLFPDEGITKGDLIEYYDAIAETMLPHVRGRALAMQRFPDGIAGDGFFQKQVGDHFPDWIRTTRVEKKGGGGQDLVVCDDRATLVYLANQACITLHAWLSPAERAERPDQFVIDLDPPGDDFEAVRRAARRARELLDEIELPSFPKLTGSKGVHLMVPLDGSEGYQAVRAFARDLAEELVRRHPDELTVEHRKENRRGRLYFDVGRNAFGQTAVAPYSVRALPGAPVAAPIEWDELGRRELGPRTYTIRNVLRRLGQREDPWRGVARRRRSLGEPARRLAELGA